MLFSVFASFTVHLWSDVGIAVLAGITTSLILVLAPYTKYNVVRIVFAGSYIGSIVWGLKKVISIQMSKDVVRSW
jgi:hypothetical protein